ncbi:Glycine rich protein [Dillenia turbinata]|uniref:Glycine rich protein n=1 Tax=Dillenia turbinata TaxID=194707 RepID=A0AAN8UW75_9MAGN
MTLKTFVLLCMLWTLVFLVPSEATSSQTSKDQSKDDGTKERKMEYDTMKGGDQFKGEAYYGGGGCWHGCCGGFDHYGGCKRCCMKNEQALGEQAYHGGGGGCSYGCCGGHDYYGRCNRCCSLNEMKSQP